LYPFPGRYQRVRRIACAAPHIFIVAREHDKSVKVVWESSYKGAGHGQYSYDVSMTINEHNDRTDEHTRVMSPR